MILKNMSLQAEEQTFSGALSKISGRAFFYLCLSLLLIAEPALAARPFGPDLADPVLEPWRWRNFQELDGLGLRCLAESGDGVLWFGTADGVRAYDGKTWTAHTVHTGLPSAPVNVLCPASDGSVYAGTEMGILRFYKDNWFRVFPPHKDLPWPIDDLIEARDGSLWAGTAWGLLHLWGTTQTLYTTDRIAKTVKHILPDLNVAIVPDRVAPLYSWGAGAGIYTAEGGYLGVPRGEAPSVVALLTGPGEQAGLRVGDLITAVDGHSFQGRDQLVGAPGTPIALTVVRKGHTFPLTVDRQALEGGFRHFPVFDCFEAQDGALWLGLSTGEIVRYANNDWRLYTQKDGLDIDRSPRIAQTQDGLLWTVSNDKGGGVNRFDGKTWTHSKLSDLEKGRDINTSILVTQDGALWVGGSGLHVFREGAWTVYDASELPFPSHRTRLLETSKGALWVAGLEQIPVRLDYRTSRWTTYQGLIFQCEGTGDEKWFLSQDGGAVVFDGQSWTRYDTRDGLIDFPWKLLATPEGKIWAAGGHKGTAATAVFTPGPKKPWTRRQHPDLAHLVSFNGTFAARDGTLWFGAFADFDPKKGHKGGVLSFDGNTWTHHRPPQAPGYVYAVGETPDGTLWFGGSHLRRFGNNTWEPVAGIDELASFIHDIDGANGNDLWVGTRAYGLFRLHGQTWTQYRVEDGLVDNQIEAVLQIPSGAWAATKEGLSRFDGRTWVPHPLPARLVDHIMQGGLRATSDGSIWINNALQEARGFKIWTYGYKPDPVPPETRLITKVDRISQPGNIALAWDGTDPWHVTSGEDLQFAWRRNGGKWSGFSSDKSRLLLNLASGPHTFEVKARDRDFNEDPTPAVVHFAVIPPVWQQPWFMGMVFVFVTVTGFQTYRIVVRTRERDRARETLVQKLEGELQIAHEMQMDLMPRESPDVPGYDVAGRCVPASHVGGDYFQYFKQDDKLTLALADVTGHDMAAAIPVVMFSGILNSHMELPGTPQERVERLNRSLCSALVGRTFVCFLMGELDLLEKRIVLSDSGCPFPYHLRAQTGQLEEIALDAYPLGIRPETEYLVAEISLQPGDCILFCSDGVIEAVNAHDEVFGYTRTEEAILAACASSKTAENIIDRGFQTIDTFQGDTAQTDDITCVVVRMNDGS